MRKFFMVAAIGVLALLVASPASALDFKFGAEYRVRFYQYLNETFTDEAGAGGNPRGIQTRIRPRFDVSDDNGNMTATLRLEIGDVEWGNGGGAHGVTNGTNIAGSGGARVGNGSGGGLGADGINVETKWAYVDFASPFGLPLRWRAGIQPWFLSKGLIMDDDVSGARAYGKYGIVSYEAGFYRAGGGLATNACPASSTGLACQTLTTNTLDDNNDFYQGKIDFTIAPWLNAGAYYIYGDNRATNTTGLAPGTPIAAITEPVAQHFIGASLAGDLKFLKYDVDFIYGMQEGGNTGNFTSGGARVDVSGWVVDAGVHIPIGPVLIHLVGSWATGDDQDGGDSEAMPYISPSWNGAGGLYEIIGSGGAFDVFDTQDYPGGLWMLGAGVEYRPVKALWMRFMYGYAGFTSKEANCAFNPTGVARTCYGPVYTGKGFSALTGSGGLAGESGLGHEFSFRADYDLWTNFKIQGAAGWLVPNGGDTYHEYILQLLYNF